MLFGFKSVQGDASSIGELGESEFGELRKVVELGESNKLGAPGKLTFLTYRFEPTVFGRGLMVSDFYTKRISESEP